MQITLQQFEVVDSLFDQLIRMGDFETCADPRKYVQVSNCLFDACLEIGMDRDVADHEAWANAFLMKAISSATIVMDDAA